MGRCSFYPGLLCLTFVFAACAADPHSRSPETGDPGALVFSHAHNDYENERPLFDALEARIYSVEADLYFSEGDAEVGHYLWDLKGTLQELYLDPLQERVDEKQSVYGDGHAFVLWLDFKSDAPELLAEVERLLNAYSMVGDAVKVVLTGEASAKIPFVEDTAAVVERDSNSIAPDDPDADSLWTHYALNWQSHLSWNGLLDPSETERAELFDLVEAAHEKGRKLRLWNAPDHEMAWQLQLEAGVDYINTDRVSDLASFLKDAQP
jgi:hypothetical protein